MNICIILSLPVHEDFFRYCLIPFSNLYSFLYRGLYRGSLKACFFNVKGNGVLCFIFVGVDIYTCILVSRRPDETYLLSAQAAITDATHRGA